MANQQRDRHHKPAKKRSPRRSTAQRKPETNLTQGLLLQRAQMAPDSLTPVETLLLQHALGNQAVGRLIAPTIQREPDSVLPSQTQPESASTRIPQVVQRNGTRPRTTGTATHPYSSITLPAEPALTVAKLREALNLGVFSLEGTSLKAIQKEVRAYESTRTGLPQKLKIKDYTGFEEGVKQCYEMLKQIEADITIYRERHKEDKSRTDRVAGMGQVLTMIGTERSSLPSAHPFVQPVTLGQTGGMSVFSEQQGRQQRRQTLITGELNNILTEVIDNYLKVKAIDPVLEVFGVNTIDLRKSQEALALRRQLKAIVSAQIEKEITTGGGTADQIEDAKAYIAELAKSSQADILDQVSKTEAGKIVDEVLAAEKSNIEAAIKQALLGAPLTDPAGKVKLAGHAAGMAKLPDIQNKAVTKAQLGLKNIVRPGGASSLIDALKHGVETETTSKALGTGEITKRIALESELDTVASDTLVDQVIAAIIKKPLKTKLAFKLGESRRFLRKDNSSRQFRQGLKDTARDKAAEKIHSEVETGGQLGATPSEARKKFVEMQAQSYAYTDVKQYVDSVSLAKADEIIDALITASLKADIKKAAKTELYSLLRSDDHATPEQKLASATLGANNKASELYNSLETNAFSKTRGVVEGTDTSGLNVKTEVESQVETQYDVTGVVKRVVEAENISKGLALIGGIIDTAVPTVGSQAKLDLQLKIPIPKTPTYVTIQFLGEVGRDWGGSNRSRYEMVKARAELTFGLGVQVAKLLDVSAQFGVVMEAQGADSTKLMQLFSYGTYRGLRNAGFNKFADRMWGMGGQTRKTGGGRYTAQEEAEIWAAMVEEEAMTKKDAYVDVGLIGKAKGVGNVGIGKIEAELKAAGQRRYNKKTLGALKGKVNKTRAEITEASKGQKLLVVELGGKLEFAGESMSGEVKARLTAVIEGTNKGVIGIEIEGEYQFIAAFGKKFEKFVEILAQYIAALAEPLTKFLGTVQNQVNSIQTPDPKKRIGGAVGQTALDATFPATAISGEANQIAENIIKSGGENFKDVVMGQDNPLLEMKSALGIGFKLNFTRKTPTTSFEPGFEIYLVHAKSMKLDAGVFRSEIEMKQRLGRVGTEGIGFMGLGKKA